MTGASSGIGEGLAEALGKDGAHVAIAARREEKLGALADRIEAAGGRVKVVRLDVRDPDAVVETIKDFDDEVGGLDLVVANAGVTLGRFTGKMTWAEAARVIDVNVSGAVATMCAVLPRMCDRKRGHVVGVSSLASYRAVPKLAVYSGTKAFMSRFMEGMRIDVAPVGVTVTDVRPGFVKTDILDGMGQTPLAVDVNYATNAIMDGIAKRAAVVEFPRSMATIIHGASAMPDRLYEALITRTVKR